MTGAMSANQVSHRNAGTTSSSEPDHDDEAKEQVGGD